MRKRTILIFSSILLWLFVSCYPETETSITRPTSVFNVERYSSEAFKRLAANAAKTLTKRHRPPSIFGF